jgi:hypothetical protein
MTIKHILILSEWGKAEHSVPQGSAVNNNSKPVLFADDTSVTVSNPNLVNFTNGQNFSFEQLNAQFNTNLLSLNYNKTQYVQFRTTNSIPTQVNISYKNKYSPKAHLF